MSARVTAIVPIKAYDERYMREAFASLFSQTLAAWEAIVVVETDDLEKFRALLANELSDERVRLMVNEGRKLAGAINTAMRAAGTDYAAILLADDLWDVAAIEVLTREIEAHPDADFLHSARRAIDDDGNPRSAVLPPKQEIRVEAFPSGSQVKHLMCFFECPEILFPKQYRHPHPSDVHAAFQ